jgi:hypothetical protein
MTGESENPVDNENDLKGKIEKIHSFIIKKEQTNFFEILIAVMLSLATIGSAWCAYQSGLWGSVQTFELAAAGKAGRLSSENVIKANQKKIMDGIIVLNYIEAIESGNKKLENFYFNRFNPDLKRATLEWLKLDPFNNENAPVSPMQLESYNIKEDEEALNQFYLTNQKLEIANEARDISNKYVLLTVLFAGVLFFGGMASTLRAVHTRKIFLIISSVILMFIFFALFNMPLKSI